MCRRGFIKRIGRGFDRRQRRKIRRLWHRVAPAALVGVLAATLTDSVDHLPCSDPQLPSCVCAVGAVDVGKICGAGCGPDMSIGDGRTAVSSAGGEAGCTKPLTAAPTANIKKNAPSIPNTNALGRGSFDGRRILTSCFTTAPSTLVVNREERPIDRSVPNGRRLVLKIKSSV